MTMYQILSHYRPSILCLQQIERRTTYRKSQQFYFIKRILIRGAFQYGELILLNRLLQQHQVSVFGLEINKQQPCLHQQFVLVLSGKTERIDKDEDLHALDTDGNAVYKIFKRPVISIAFTFFGYQFSDFHFKAL